MSSSTPELVSTAVITVSDSCSRGEKPDISGLAVAATLEKHGRFSILHREVVPDERESIESMLATLSERVHLILTTGGTGIAPRDVTPEATRAVCDRLVEGIAEVMRAEGVRKTRYAALSRGVCGIRGRTLILNLPGSPKGAVESLESVIELLPHAIDLLNGKTGH